MDHNDLGPFMASLTVQQREDLAETVKRQTIAAHARPDAHTPIAFNRAARETLIAVATAAAATSSAAARADVALLWTAIDRLDATIKEVVQLSREILELRP